MPRFSLKTPNARFQEKICLIYQGNRKALFLKDGKQHFYKPILQNL